MIFIIKSRTNLVLLFLMQILINPIYAGDQTDDECFEIMVQTIKDLSEKVKDHDNLMKDYDKLLTEKDATIKEMSQKIDLLNKIVTSEDPLEDRVEKLEEIVILLNTSTSILDQAVEVNKELIMKNGNGTEQLQRDMDQRVVEINILYDSTDKLDFRISDNLDLINTNDDVIKNELETSIANLKTEFQDSIDFVKENLEDSIATVKTNLEDSIDSVRTNLEVSISENLDQINDLQTSMGNVESFPPPGRIIFSAYKAEGGYFSGDVTYTREAANIGNGMDLRSGVFSCPQSGLYMLSFSGRTSNVETDTFVGVYTNGVQDFVLGTYSNSFDEDAISHTWLVHLNYNDQVNLKVTQGQMYSISDRRITFNGMQVQ